MKMNIFKVNQTGFAPAISSYTNFGEGIGIFGATSNNSFLMAYLEGNLLILEENPTLKGNIEQPIINQEHSKIKNAIVERKNPAILKHL